LLKLAVLATIETACHIYIPVTTPQPPATRSMQSFRAPLIAAAKHTCRRTPAITQTSGVIRQHFQRATFSSSTQRATLTSPL